MENDNNKNDSNGRRVTKKALRRNSRTSNSSHPEKKEDGSKNIKKKVEIHEEQDGTSSSQPATSKSDSILAKDLTKPLVEKDSYRKHLKRKLEEESAAGTSGASAGASDTDPDDKDPSKDKKKKNRCAVCRKKVGLTGFECRCGGLFCALHRYSDKHECSFDYRELGAQEIRRNNPVVVSQKIDKI